MIVSDEIQLKLNLPVAADDIEHEFNSRGLRVLRWAITKIEDGYLTVRFAFEKD